jgi:4-amino-4-deoxy-L-arabinose transferase-like glycosyltransferase
MGASGTVVDERPVVSSPAPPDDPYPRPTDGRRFAIAMAIAAAAALAVRLANVLWWRPTNIGGSSGYTYAADAPYYHLSANALAKGAWYVNPFAYFDRGVELPSAAHPPLYVTYLALWSRLGLDTVTWHRVASCMLGVASVVVIGYLARRLAGPVVGIVAAAIAAVYPQLWINDGMLLSESLAILMTAITLFALYAFARRPTLRNAVLTGIACGFAALSRTELALLFVVAVVPIALMARSLSWKDRGIRAVVACLVGGAVLLPWIAYNESRFREPTTMTTGTGAALNASACDATFSGYLMGYYANCFRGPLPKASLDESQRDLIPRQQAIDYLESHKRRIPIVVLARVGRLWGFFRPSSTTYLDWYLEGRGREASWIGLFAYYALLPFAVGGLVVLHRRRISILPLVAIAGVATFAAATTFGVTRYRAPAEVAIVVAAAVALVATWHWFARRRASSAVPDAESTVS